MGGSMWGSLVPVDDAPDWPWLLLRQWLELAPDQDAGVADDDGGQNGRGPERRLAHDADGPGGQRQDADGDEGVGLEAIENEHWSLQFEVHVKTTRFSKARQ